MLTPKSCWRSRGRGDSSQTIEIDIGVERFIAQILVQLAVKGVAPRFDREVDDAARRVSVLGGILRRADCEFLKGVRSRRDFGEEGAVLGASRRRAVDQYLRAESLPAVDAEIEPDRASRSRRPLIAKIAARSDATVKKDERERRAPSRFGARSAMAARGPAVR